MSAEDGRRGTPADGDRGGPRFPHADDIVVPEELALEEVEPTAAAGESRPRRGRAVAAWLGRCLRRGGGRLRLAFDGLLLALTVPVPLLVLAWQSFEWLRTSAWPPMPVARLLELLQLDPVGLARTPWPGLSALLDWLFAAPLAAVLFAGGLGLHVLTGLLLPRIRAD